MNTIDIQILDTDLNIQQLLDFVTSEESGGIDIFVGNVRNHTKGKTVTKLEFEAYSPMAIKEMTKIANRALEKFDLSKVSMHHRIGILFPAQTAVIIACAADHRDAAFKACRFCIDELKKSVPIWKKEFFEDGAVWVAAHP